MACFRIETTGEIFSQPTMSLQQKVLADSTLRGQAPLPPRTEQGFKSRMMDGRVGRKVPSVVGFFPTLAIQGCQPVIPIMRMESAPVVELRPASFKQPRRVTRGGSVLGMGGRMAEAGNDSTGKAVAIHICTSRRAVDCFFNGG